MVFAATNNLDVQKRVIAEALAEDALLNCADRPEDCTFQVPATVRQGALLLAVSTGGTSPALSAWIRKRLADEFGIEYGLLVDLFGAIRSQIVGDGASCWAHKQVFDRLLSVDMLSCLRDRDWPALHARLAPILPESINAAQLVAAISATQGSKIDFDLGDDCA